MKRRSTPYATNNFPHPLRRGSHSKQADRQGNRGAVCFVAILAVFLACGLYLLAVPPAVPPESQPSIQFYIPKSRKDGAWGSPLVHIVNTRFMQEQGNLTSLGKARLALFKVFCFPTMRAQTTQNFLWIIKTDPDIDRAILLDMIQLLSPHPNFYLVASNVNFRVNEQFPGAWRGGAEVRDLERSKVFTGNRTLLENAMALHSTLDPVPVVETRLDADDGLHIKFLETIQDLATTTFLQNGESERPHWSYWCSRRHIEWHASMEPSGPQPVWKLISKFGSIAGIQHSKLCITPGFTVGFGVGTAEEDVPVHAHDKLLERISGAVGGKSCGLEDPVKCVQFVETFVFEAIRSRSPTSAGMLRVSIAPEEITTDSWLYFAFLNMIYAKFGIPFQHLQWINRYLAEHLVAIASDNLIGQCTTGHSCKVRFIPDIAIVSIFGK